MTPDVQATVQVIGTWATTSGYAGNGRTTVVRKRDAMSKEPEAIAELRRGLGERLTTYRKLADLSQAELGRKLYSDRTTILRLEQGGRAKDERFWQRADDVLHAGGVLLTAFHEIEAAKAEYERQQREAERDARLQQVAAWREERDSSRHEVVSELLPAGLDDVEHLRQGLHDTLSSGSLAEASLDDWEQIVWRYGKATRDRPAGLLVHDLSTDLADLKRLMTHCRSASTLRRLTRTTAQMSGLMLLTLVKLDNRQAFRRWARTARIAAAEVDDPLTYSWVLAQEAYGHYYSGDLAEALDVAEQAQVVARNTGSVGAPLAAALEARVYGVMGQSRETHDALARAEQMLGKLDKPSMLPSAFGYNEAQLRFHAGNAYTHLDDSRHAVASQERALALYSPSDYMDRAFTKLDRAMCLAQDGDTKSAAAYAMQTMMELNGEQRQGIITGRAYEVWQALPKQQRTLPASRDLHELLMLTPSTNEGA